MKTRTFLSLLAVVLGTGVARGTLYNETWSGPNTAIPVGNPVGTAVNELVSDIPGGETVGGLTVNLNISGGYNGNLYAYLVAPNGTLVTLLNQPGVSGSNPFGYAGSGLNNVTLQDDGSGGNIGTATEVAGQALTGIYSAAGTLANFNGSAADGTWTLFFADEAAGGGQPTLTSWSLDITAVPEPVNVALEIFGCLLAVWSVSRRFKVGATATLN